MSPLAVRTLFHKFWDSHLIATLGDGRGLVHIDRHLLHELASPGSAAAIAGWQADPRDFMEGDHAGL